MLKILGTSGNTKIDISHVIKDPIINNFLVKTGNTSFEYLKKSLGYSLKNKLITLENIGTNQGQLVFQILDQQESNVSSTSSNETLFEFFEKNISQLTPTLVDNIKRSIAVHSEKNVKLAIMIAAKSNVRNWNYISAILNRWEKEGGTKNIGNGTLGQNTFADRSDEFLEKYHRHHN
jgi:DnaD/phage-associated family protein